MSPIPSVSSFFKSTYNFLAKNNEIKVVLPSILVMRFLATLPCSSAVFAEILCGFWDPSDTSTSKRLRRYGRERHAWCREMYRKSGSSPIPRHGNFPDLRRGPELYQGPECYQEVLVRFRTSSAEVRNLTWTSW